ncbi:MAG: TonB-dependent receptor [Bacteroidales bacterium]|nr:TonB-dependent receptor [Bacteroidales bacterium]
MKKIIILPLLMISMLFCYLGYTQEVDTVKFQRIIDLPFEDMLNLKVVTASKSEQFSSAVTQKVDVVTQRQIESMVSGNRNLAELIQYLPGASVKALSRNDANWGAYGGIGPKYNTYMIQGLPMDAFIDPQSIDIMAFQRIEVQRGPASILYPNYLSQDFAGNQSPLAGTVNLILKDQINGPSTTVAFDYGSYNTISAQAYHENKIGRSIILAGVSYEDSDYTDYGSEGSWLNILDKPQYQKAKAFIGGNLKLDKREKHKISLFANQTYHWGDWGRTFREYDFNYSLINLEYKGSLSNTVDLAVKEGLRWYNREYQGDTFDEISNVYILKETSGVDQLIIPMDISLSVKHFDKCDLTVGVDGQIAYYTTWEHAANAERKTRNDAMTSQIGIYVQEEIRINNFTLRGGARMNNITYNIDQIGGQSPGENDREWNVVLWSGGAKYMITKNIFVFANAGNSFMSPGLKATGGTTPLSDKYIAGRDGQLPNPDLQPESGFSLDFGIDSKLIHNIFLSARVFNTELTDAIIDVVISQNPSQTQSVNAEGKTIGRGFELGIRQQIGKKIDWFGNITFTHSEILDPDDDDQDGVELPFVPALMGNMGTTLHLPAKIGFSAWAHFGGQIYDGTSKDSRTLYKSGEVINLVATKAIHTGDNAQIKVYIKAYNITNNRFEMPWQFRDPGFNMSAGVKVNFK